MAKPSFSRRWPDSLELDKRAYMIAFIGIDGAGKSTQANQLAQWLTELGYRATLHPNESLQPIKAALTVLAKKDGVPGPVELLGLETSQLLYATLKWNTMIKVREAALQDRHFVIMDRYSYCQIAAARCQELKCANIIEGLFSLFPRPDLTFLIDVSPEQAMHRIATGKIDDAPLTLSFLRRHSQAYRELEDAQHFRFVDGQRSLNEVGSELKKHMLDHFPFLGAGTRLCHGANDPQ